MIAILEFFFQDFFHWLGGLIYLVVGIGSFGMVVGLIAEIFRK